MEELKIGFTNFLVLAIVDSMKIITSENIN